MQHANRRYIANEHAIDTDMIVWSFGVAQTTFPVFSETRSARNTSSFGRNNFLLFIDGDLRPKHDMNEPSKVRMVNFWFILVRAIIKPTNYKGR